MKINFKKLRKEYLLSEDKWYKEACLAFPSKDLVKDEKKWLRMLNKQNDYIIKKSDEWFLNAGKKFNLDSHELKELQDNLYLSNLNIGNKNKKIKIDFYSKFVLVTISLFIFFLALTWHLSYFNSPSKRNQNNNATQCASGLNDPRFKVEGLEEASTSSVQETCPSPQELNGDICKTLVFTKPLKSEIIFNNEIKKDKYVKYLRKAIDNFLSDEYILNEAYENLVKIDPVYLKGKFIIISIDDSMFGGKDILLISKNKPDKIFLAWVYGNGENEPLTLRNFEEVDGPPCISDIQKVVINQLCNDAFGF